MKRLATPFLFLFLLVASLACIAPQTSAATGDPADPRTAKEIPLKLQINIPGFDKENQIVYGPAQGCPKDTVCVKTITSYANAIYRWAAGVAGLFAIVLLMIGGVEYMLGSAVGSISRAKDRLRNAAMGLLLLFSTTAVLSFINPDITKLGGLELPIIETVFLSTENTDQDVAFVGPGDPPAPTKMPIDFTPEPIPTIPYFNQQNYPDAAYGACGTIKSAGCGPTSTAMILSYLQVSIDPEIVANTFAQEGYRSCQTNSSTGAVDCDQCLGTSWGAFTSTALLSGNDLAGRQLPSSNRNKILKLLGKGKPLIAVMGCSRFTAHGHFVVLAGIAPDGRIRVYDPNSASRKWTTEEELFDRVFRSEGRDCANTGRAADNRPPLKAAWLIENKVSILDYLQL